MAKVKSLKTHKELGITRKQRRNIAKLAMFVRDKVEPPKFNIKYFYAKKNTKRKPGEDLYDNSMTTDEIGKPKYECGTVACFCGYGPLAGIRPKRGEGWADYGARAFGADMEKSYVDNLRQIWLFLFSDDHKNSKIAACKRAAWLLQNGLPITGAHYGYWEVPRSFKPDWSAIDALAKS